MCWSYIDTLVSGSPLIQNGKLIGAVTHVLVDDPTLCVRYPSSHLLIKKQFPELFFLTFAALLGFKSRHKLYKQKIPKPNLKV